MRTTTNRVTHSDDGSKAAGKSGVALRTGKIHLSRASASTIRSIIGVRPADDRLAQRALSSASKSKESLEKAAKSAPARIVSKAASKKR
jgi:hypothetical protein